MSVKSRQKYSKIMRRRKQKIERRLKRKQWEDQERPMFKGRNIQYEVAEKSQAINCGGIGAIHQMVQRCGLVEEIDLSSWKWGCEVKVAEGTCTVP